MTTLTSRNAETSIDLEPGLNEFACGRCGHHVGDHRTRNWYGACPACNRLTRFFRVME